MPATITKDVVARSIADPRGAARATIAAGTAVWVEGDAVRGFRRVRIADGRSGWVEEGALSLRTGNPDPLPGMPGTEAAEKELPGDTI